MTSHRTSTILSALALVVALTGAGAQASGLIDGHSIRAHSISASKLTRSAQSFLRGQRGEQGIAGQDGLNGTPGSTGLPGPVGSFSSGSISYVTGPSTSVPAGGVATVQALCPAGDIPIGGGHFASITNVAYSNASNGSSGSGWVIIVNNNSLIPVTVNAFAVCVASS